MDANRGSRRGFLAAVLCFGVQSRREKQTVVLETQNSFSKEVDDSQESSERPAKRSNGGAVEGIMKQQRTLAA